MALPNLWQTLQPGALTDAAKLGVWVAKALAVVVWIHFFFPVNLPRVIVLRKGGTRTIRMLRQSTILY